LGLARLNKRAAKSAALNAAETPKRIPRTDLRKSEGLLNLITIRDKQL
jgi:hypothetical protein